MKPEPTLAPGDLVAERFEVHAEVGSGGMGRVYRATLRDPRGGASREVALKLLRETHVITARDRFRREARVLAELDHPSIVRFVDSGEVGGVPFLAMEWVNGEDLERRLARGALTLDESRVLFRRLADGLRAAHARGIVHRDVKPSNVLLEDGLVARARLADFGLASLSSSAAMTHHALTVTGEVLGTPSYMAPEQVRGERVIDARADVFSLGCLFFECLTGRPAFGGMHVRAVLAKILFEEAPRISWYRGDLPANLDALIASMLAKDPSDRPADGGAVLERLDALGDDPFAPEVGSVDSHPNSGALGDGAMRWTFVVVASPEPDAVALADTEALGGDEPREPAALLAIAQRHGADLKELADGTIFALFRNQSSASDGAAMAGRCALALSLALPRARVSLSALRSNPSGSMRIGDLFERAVAQSALAGKVTVDPDVVSLLEGRFVLHRREDGGHTCFELEREELMGVVRARLLLGRVTPVVGRERELASLRAMLEEVRDEHVARAVIVTAPPGVGKTRLQQELIAQTMGFEVWVARADAMRAGAPMHLSGRLISTACGIEDVYEEHLRREAIRREVAARLEPSKHASVAEVLGEIAGARTSEPSPRLAAAREDPFALMAAIRSAWEDFVEATSNRGPLLIVLEDLHWGDLPSVKLIETALRRCEGKPLAVLALARPEVFDVFPQLWASRQPVHMPLPELSRRARERLIRHVLGDTVSDDVVARLAELSAGNAFFLEELIRAAADRRSDQLPVSVAAMVESRLDALGPTARRLIHLASVFGEVFWVEGVRALAPMNERADAAAVLQHLVDAELLTFAPTSRFAHQREVVFRHALVREAAYHSLSAEDARAAHAVVAEWLVQAGEREPLVLAEHFERAGLHERAAHHYAEATAAALRTHDWTAAIAHARRSASLQPADHVMARVLVMEGEALAWSGSVAEGAHTCTRADELLRRANVPIIEMCATLGWTAILTAFASRETDLTFAARIADDLRAVAKECVERADFQRAVGYVVTVLYFGGAPEVALALVNGTKDKPRDPRANGWYCFHRCLHARFTLGDTWASRCFTLEAVRSFESSLDSVGATHLLTQCALDEISLGLHSVAYEHARDARQMSDRYGIRLLGAMAYGAHAIAAAERGYFDEARQVIDDTERISREINDTFYGAYSMALAARAARICGDLARAKSLALWSLDQTSLLAIRATAGMQLANVTLAMGDYETAYVQAGFVIEMSRGRVVRGGLDLDLWVALVESLRKLGRPEAEGAAKRARSLIEDRAAQITDGDLRREFLASSWVQTIGPMRVS